MFAVTEYLLSQNMVMCINAFDYQLISKIRKKTNLIEDQPTLGISDYIEVTETYHGYFLVLFDIEDVLLFGIIYLFIWPI